MSPKEIERNAPPELHKQATWMLVGIPFYGTETNPHANGLEVG